MQEIGDICDCRRPANTVDTKRVSFMHSRGALCHVKILIFFFGRRGGGEASPVSATTYCDPRKIMHLFSLVEIVTLAVRARTKEGKAPSALPLTGPISSSLRRKLQHGASKLRAQRKRLHCRLQSFIRGDSAPRSNPLPFYILFLKEKVLLSYTFY